MNLRRIFWYFAILFFGKYSRVDILPGSGLQAERATWRGRSITMQIWHQGVDYTDKDDPHLFTGLENDRRLDKSPSLQNNKELIAYLVNKAEALRDLVVAAKAAYETDGDTRLGEALAKLEEV